MSWERKTYINPAEMLRCRECGEEVHVFAYDTLFNMCRSCLALYDLEEERDLERWEKYGDKCILCSKGFRGSTVVKFRRGWAHWVCAEKFLNVEDVLAEMGYRKRGDDGEGE